MSGGRPGIADLVVIGEKPDSIKDQVSMKDDILIVNEVRDKFRRKGPFDVSESATHLVSPSFLPWCSDFEYVIDLTSSIAEMCQLVEVGQEPKEGVDPDAIKIIYEQELKSYIINGSCFHTHLNERGKNKLLEDADNYYKKHPEEPNPFFGLKRILEARQIFLREPRPTKNRNVESWDWSPEWEKAMTDIYLSKNWENTYVVVLADLFYDAYFGDEDIEDAMRKELKAFLTTPDGCAFSWFLNNSLLLTAFDKLIKSAIKLQHLEEASTYNDRAYQIFNNKRFRDEKNLEISNGPQEKVFNQMLQEVTEQEEKGKKQITKMKKNQNNTKVTLDDASDKPHGVPKTSDASDKSAHFDDGVPNTSDLPSPIGVNMFSDENNTKEDILLPVSSSNLTLTPETCEGPEPCEGLYLWTDEYRRKITLIPTNESEPALSDRLILLGAYPSDIILKPSMWSDDGKHYYVVERCLRLQTYFGNQIKGFKPDEESGVLPKLQWKNHILSELQNIHRGIVDCLLHIREKGLGLDSLEECAFITEDGRFKLLPCVGPFDEERFITLVKSFLNDLVSLAMEKTNQFGESDLSIELIHCLDIMVPENLKYIDFPNLLNWCFPWTEMDRVKLLFKIQDLSKSRVIYRHHFNASLESLQPARVPGQTCQWINSVPAAGSFRDVFDYPKISYVLAYRTEFDQVRYSLAYLGHKNDPFYNLSGTTLALRKERGKELFEIFPNLIVDLCKALLHYSKTQWKDAATDLQVAKSKELALEKIFSKEDF